LEAEVSAEILAIWNWLQRQKLRPGQFDWNAGSYQQGRDTLRQEWRCARRGWDDSPSHETRIVLALPEKVAIQFRFQFNVVDDRR
jgi:hypothetical protein